MEIYVLPLHSPPPPEEVHLSRLQLKVGPLADLRWWQTMQLAMQEMPARSSLSSPTNQASASFFDKHTAAVNTHYVSCIH
jgi:hypothetical protein